MKKAKYRAVVIDDNEQLRRLIVEGLRFSDMEVEGFSEAEEFLRRLAMPSISKWEAQPDLVVVDLELKPRKKQGLELISDLVEMNVASEIVAITGHHSSSDLVENAMFFGAAAIITKPFTDHLAFLHRLEQLAKIGQNRRSSRMAGATEWYDLSRRHRPVFLSYATGDWHIANGIRRNLEIRNIGTWYAATTLEPGDRWRKRIEAGIDKASIFVPVMTSRYLKSAYCIGELARFHRRLQSPSRAKLVMLPVLVDSSIEGSRNVWVRRILDDYHAISFTPRLTDGLTVLLARVQQLVSHTRPRSGSRPAVPSAPVRRRG